MKRTNKKKYSIVLFTLILALGVIAGAYALLNDSVTLTGSATIVEADNVGLEIIGVESIGLAKYKIGANAANPDNASEYVEFISDVEGLWTISEDKKELEVTFGDINVDTYEGYNTFATVTVKNTSNVPVTITFPSAITNNGIGIGTEVSICSATGEFLSIADGGYTEVLAAGAELTFDISAGCTNLEQYSNGDELSGTFTISATKYTGEETPLGSHTHEAQAGGV